MPTPGTGYQLPDYLQSAAGLYTNPGQSSFTGGTSLADIFSNPSTVAPAVQYYDPTSGANSNAIFQGGTGLGTIDPFQFSSPPSNPANFGVPLGATTSNEAAFGGNFLNGLSGAFGNIINGVGAAIGSAAPTFIQQKLNELLNPNRGTATPSSLGPAASAGAANYTPLLLIGGGLLVLVLLLKK